MSEPSEDFDCDEIFDADYLAFHEHELDDAANDADAGLIAMLLGLDGGERVLDLPCGHGRIARRLAGMGCDVVGVDRSAAFLERARADALRHRVAVDYRRGDMREIAFDGEFDHVVNWFTSFGYFDDDTLRGCLSRIRRALVPGGTLLLETLNLHDPELADHEQPRVRERLVDGSPHVMLDLSRYDPHDGRLYARRLLLRSGRPTRSLRYFLRLFSLPELRGWLAAAGFVDVQAFGGDGEVFRVDSSRLIVTARRP